MTNVEALEAFEMAQDVAAYRQAKAEDDGTRVTLDELRADLAGSQRQMKPQGVVESAERFTGDAANDAAHT